MDAEQSEEACVPTTSQKVSKLEKYLQQKEALVSAAKESRSNQSLKLDDKILIAYSVTPRIPTDSDVFSYWKEKKESWKELYELACIFNGIPCTQVSVERLFSGLKFILNPYRLRLKNDMVSDILLLRNNRKLW